MIEQVRPQIDGGRFPIKRVVSELVAVEAVVFADGHDALACRILYRHADDQEWQPAPTEPLGNDNWRGEFLVSKLGRYEYTVEGWIDRFATWRGDLVKRIAAGQDIRMDCLIGAVLVEAAAAQAPAEDAALLRQWAYSLREKRALARSTTTNSGLV